MKASDESQIKNELIVLTQKPIIEFSAMEARGLEVATEIQQLNLDTIDATEENRSMMKKIRANLNKELTVFEDQRKLIHGMITKPYKDFTDSYEKNIKFLYVDAEKQLKEKISLVETKMLDDKMKDIESYFNSKNDFGFINIAHVGLNVILSVTHKKMTEQIDEFLEKISKDVDAIKKMDHQVRIMSLYEKTLDYSGSVAQVLSDIEAEKRLEAQKAERERLEAEEKSRREKQALIDAENASRELAERKRIEAERAEKSEAQARKNAELNKTKEAEDAVKLAAKAREDAAKRAEEAKAEDDRLVAEKTAREAKEAEEAKIYTMTFKVGGTKAQLVQIKEFLNTLGVSYE